MTKLEIAGVVATKAGISINEAGGFIDIVMDAIADAVKNGREVTLRGFGSFKMKTRKARKGRNIGKGTIIDIPAKDVPTFKPSKNFGE